MGKTARAVHWTGHRHSARVPCPGAAGCVTLRFVRGFSSEVYAAEKTIQHCPPEAETKKRGGRSLPGAFPALRRDGGPGQLPASVGDTRNPACRGAALAADSRERTAPISLWHLHECHTGTRTLPPDHWTELPASQARCLGQFSCRSLHGNAQGYHLCPRRKRPERKRCGGTGDKR